MSSHVPAVAASLKTLCVTVRTTVAMALTRWNVLRPPVVPVNSSVETRHASLLAGCAMMTLTVK